MRQQRGGKSPVEPHLVDITTSLSSQNEQELRGEVVRKKHPTTSPTVAEHPLNSDQVWVNTKSGKYWRPGSRYYGKTKRGEYLPKTKRSKTDTGSRTGRGNPNDELEYIAPELLPEWSDTQELLFGRQRDDPPDSKATACYAFLHDGILRISKLGEHAKDAAIYWRYGCWLYEQTTRSQVLIESRWDDSENEAGTGNICLRAWGENAESLIDRVLDPLRKLPVGQAPKTEQTKRFPVHACVSSFASDLARLVQNPLSGDAVSSSHGERRNWRQSRWSEPTRNYSATRDFSQGQTGNFVSYAWGEDSSEEARKRTEVVDRLCEALRKDGWNILRDSDAMRTGDLISGFMKRIGLADHVIVVLSDKYLCSPYCMTELAPPIRTLV
jgi:internalin A